MSNATSATSGRSTPSPSEIQFQMGKGSTANYKLGVDARVLKVRKLLSEVPPGGKMLDVGCADGGILSPFLKTHELHGVDHHDEFTSKARQRGMQALTHDVSSGPLPYPDKMFDAVFSGETIEHQVDTDWFLAEINRVLKPGGLLVLTLPNIRTPLSLGMMIILGIPPKFSARYRAPHYRDFTLKVGKIAIENHGFEIQKITGGNMHIPGFGQTASWLASLLPGWADTIIYKAIKRSDSKYSLEEAGNCDIYGIYGKE